MIAVSPQKISRAFLIPLYRAFLAPAKPKAIAQELGEKTTRREIPITKHL
jgi:hypothetical protein